MKLANMIMILIIIQASILVFDAVSTPDFELSSYGSNESVVWNFVSNPTGWAGSDFLLYFISLTAVAGTIGVGVYLVTKSDTSLFFGVFTLLLGLGAIPIISIYNVFNRNAAFFGCSSIPCTPSLIAWILTGGILAVFYVLSVLEWWSGRNVG